MANGDKQAEIAYLSNEIATYSTKMHEAENRDYPQRDADIREYSARINAAMTAKRAVESGQLAPGQAEGYYGDVSQSTLAYTTKRAEMIQSGEIPSRITKDVVPIANQPESPPTAKEQFTNVLSSYQKSSMIGDVFEKGIAPRGVRGDTIAGYKYNIMSAEAQGAMMRDVNSINADFQANPQKYAGLPGVESQSIMGQEVIKLTPEFYKGRLKSESEYLSIGKEAAKKQVYELETKNPLEYTRLSTNELITFAGKLVVGNLELPLQIAATDPTKPAPSLDTVPIIGPTVKRIKETPVGIEYPLATAVLALPVELFMAPISIKEFAQSMSLIRTQPGLNSIIPEGPAVFAKSRISDDIIGFAGSYPETPEVKVGVLRYTKGKDIFDIQKTVSPAVEITSEGELRLGQREIINTFKINARGPAEMKSGELNPILGERKQIGLSMDVFKSQEGSIINIAKAPKDIYKFGGGFFDSENKPVTDFVLGPRTKYPTKGSDILIEKEGGKFVNVKAEFGGRIIDLDKAKIEMGESKIFLGKSQTPLKFDYEIKDIKPGAIPRGKSEGPLTYVDKELTQSIYSGLNKYERTEGGLMPPIQKNKMAELLPPIIKDIPKFKMQETISPFVGLKKQFQIEPLLLKTTIGERQLLSGLSERYAFQDINEKYVERYNFQQKTIQGLNLKQFQYQPVINKFVMPHPPPPVPPPPIIDIIPTGHITPPPIIPSFIPDLNIPTFGKGKARKGKRKYARRPSLIALEFDIKSTTPAVGEVTGLVARPILVSKRRKKK